MEGYNGFIVVYRKLISWGWYTDHVVKDLFLHLLLTASYKDFDYRGERYPAGTLIATIKDLSKSLKFSAQQIRTGLAKLESTGEICVKSTNKFSAITVVKWGDYQLSNFMDNNQVTNNQQTNNKQITNKTPDTYYKNKETNKQSISYTRTRAREKKENDFGGFDLQAFEEKLREG